jgi:class 3 adenylate cyclase
LRAHARHVRLRGVRAAALLALPLVLVMVLRLAPDIDERWEVDPVHFWLVLAAGVLNAGLALTISETGRRRRDARLLLIGLAFLTSAGFLGLHALATPGVFLEKGNAGFVLATPIGLVLAGAYAAASAVEYDLAIALKIVEKSRLLLAVTLGAMAVWAIFSLAAIPPLENVVTPDQVEAPLGIVAMLGVVLYGYAALGYFRLYTRRRSRLGFVIAFAFALLAEALIVSIASLPTSWHLSWWEWHVLMVISFFTIAAAAQKEWFEERFSALYLDETLAGRREVTVVFADLSGFTPFSEKHGPEVVHQMITAYFGELAPMIVDDFEGEVQDFVGDQIFAIFNKRGDQPDHAIRGARAALELQKRAQAIRQPDWPTFRCGVNTGPIIAGVVGGRGHRIHGVFGDTVNLGSRLEGQAPPGGIVIGEATRNALPPDADVRELPPLEIKGKLERVHAFSLHALP